MTDELYIVELHEQRNANLAGHPGCSYTSPPQPAAQALALVRALLGRPSDDITVADQPWRTPIAGGRRVIRLHAAQADRQLTI